MPGLHYPIDGTIKMVRAEIARAKFDTITINVAHLTHLCDEVEKLERDVELAKQDWKE